MRLSQSDEAKCIDLLGRPKHEPKPKDPPPDELFPSRLDEKQQALERLSDKERYFVDLVHNGLTCTEAAERAGYDRREARSIGQTLYNRPYIQSALKWLQLEWLRRNSITQERVLQEYASIAFSDIADLLDDDGNLLPIRKMNKRARAAMASCNITQTEFNGVSTVKLARVKMANKLPALDKLAEILEITVNKLEITGAGGGAIEVNTTLEMNDTEKARRVAFLMLQSMRKQQEAIANATDVDISE